MAKKKNINKPMEINSSMKTISLSITLDDPEMVSVMRDEQRIYSAVSRSSFAIKHKNPDIKETELLKLIHARFSGLDSHLANCANKRGIADYVADVERKIYLDNQHKKSEDKTKFLYQTVIFGSRKLFEQRQKGEISNEEFKLARLLPIYSIGESCKGANRKMYFDLTNNRFTYKSNRNLHISGTFDIQHKNYKEQLEILQQLIDSNEIPVTFNLTENQLDLSYDVARLPKPVIKKIKTRYSAIDVNPNAIGFVIYDKEELIFEQIWNLSELTKKSGLPQDHPESVYLNNKRKHEIIQICSAIVDHLVHYQVDQFGMEYLNFKQGDAGKGTNYNRLVRNVFNFTQIKNQLQKKCIEKGIAFKLIPAAYSSFIGNLTYGFPDPISAACELARRLVSPQQFNPKLIDLSELANRWKEEINPNLILKINSWKELYELVKKSKVRYRVEIPKKGFHQAFSSKSKISCLYS